MEVEKNIVVLVKSTKEVRQSGVFRMGHTQHSIVEAGESSVMDQFGLHRETYLKRKQE